MDSPNVAALCGTDGFFVTNEGDIGVSTWLLILFPMDLCAKEGRCKNLLVPVCVFFQSISLLDYENGTRIVMIWDNQLPLPAVLELWKKLV